MVTAKEARAVARQMIRENKRLLLGSYLSYFGLTLVVVLIQFLFISSTLATTFWSFASLFLLVPLTLGILHIHNMIYYRRRCSVGNLFDFYRNYPVALKTLGVSYIFSMILSAVLVPVLMITVLPLAFSGSMLGLSAAAATFIAGIVLIALVSVAIALLAEAFIMANYFIALRNRSIRFGQLLGGSLKIGGRCLLRYFLLQLSFFGWGALCCLPLVLTAALAPSLLTAGIYSISLLSLLPVATLLLFGLAIFALTVYINAASTVFFNVAIDEYEQQYPDFFRSPTPPVPPTRPSRPQETETADRYARPLRGEDMPPIPAPPVPDENPKGINAEQPVPEQPLPPKEEPVPEKVEAEIIEPQDGLCDVILISPGVGRMLVSMIICELTGMEHEQARQLVENAPKTICMNVAREEAREIAKRLTDAGARVELR